MEQILDFLVQKWPGIMTPVIVATAVWIVAKFYFKRFVVIEKKIKDAPCDKHDSGIKETRAGIKEIREVVKEMSLDVGEVKNDLSYLRGGFEMFKKGISPVAQSLSPIGLTPIGIEKSKIINAEEMVARNWEKIYENLEQNIKSKNAYDIQQYCMDTAAVHPDKFLSDSDIDSLKMLAYREGNPLMYYSPVFGIPIRDKYLSIKGIDISDVDKNDPSQK